MNRQKASNIEQIPNRIFEHKWRTLNNDIIHKHIICYVDGATYETQWDFQAMFYL